MDRSLYISGSGATASMQTQAVKANNLANAGTPGFKAQFQQQISKPIWGAGMPTRVFTESNSKAHDFSMGTIKTTSNPMHAVAQGADSWFAVLRDGAEVEGYTKRGDFQLDGVGNLINGAGDLVLGEGGPINLPPSQSMEISADGFISIVPQGAEPGASVVIDRLKLVKLDTEKIQLREDGLFINKDNSLGEVDGSIKVLPGALEMSNVNAIGELMDLIVVSRQHEMDIKMMKATQDNDEAAARILHFS